MKDQQIPERRNGFFPNRPGPLVQYGDEQSGIPEILGSWRQENHKLETSLDCLSRVIL